MTAVLALSLSTQIEKYGAYAGIAAVVGLGVLSLLYFAQAREVKRLREWAGRAPERDAELQQRVVAEAGRRTPVAPAARPVPAPRPSGPSTPAAVAAAAAAQAPAAGGGPAVTAAGTPAPAPGTQPGTPTGPKPVVPAAAAAAAAAGAVTAAGTPAPGQTPPASGGAPGAPAPAGAPAAQKPAATAGPAPAAPPRPAVAAAAAPVPSAVPPGSAVPPAPAATPPAVAPTSAPPAPEAPPARPPAPSPAERPAPAPPAPAPARQRPRPPAAPVRATRGDGPAPRDLGEPPAEQGSRRGLLGVVLGGVAIAAVAVLLITQVFSGDDTSSTPKPNVVGTPTTAAGGGGQPAGKPQPARATTQVAVFNGTTVTGLARAAADKLTAAGYKNVGPVTTDTTNQARASTVVYWQSGSRREGVDVATLIGVGKPALVPMDQNARVLGGGAPVVVIVGADQAK